MTTKHNHSANFGRLVEGCPRCKELANGAPPIVWRTRREEDAQRLTEIRNHGCARSHCGPVCTFGEW